MKHLNRPHVVKYKPATATVKKFKVAQLAGKWHWHSCSDRECRQVYHDTCETPETNGRCRFCRTGESSAYDDWRLPKDCCFGNCELLTDATWAEWAELAGPGPWYRCRSCRRTHGSPLD